MERRRSMKLTPSSTARSKTFFAFSRVGGATNPSTIDQYIPAEQKRFLSRARACRRDNFL
jgi:hypothetical protein